MRKLLFVLMSICMLALVVGCGMMLVKQLIAQSLVRQKKFTIQAAASLKGALTELADAYKKEHHLADDQIVIKFCRFWHIAPTN